MTANDNEPGEHKRSHSSGSETPAVKAVGASSRMPESVDAFAKLLAGVVAPLLDRRRIVAPLLDRRRYEWRRELRAGFRSLETQTGVDLSRSREHEVFKETLEVATQIAMGTDEREKKDALRNAILNSAMPNAPARSRQQLFLHLLDIFTEWHIRLLRLFRDPRDWAKNSGHQFPEFQAGRLSQLLEDAYPELHGQQSLYDNIWANIYAHDLTETATLHRPMSGRGLTAKRLTGLGREFLRFIGDPAVNAKSDA